MGHQPPTKQLSNGILRVLVSLQSLLRTADYLKIKGLCELSENREETNSFLNATLGCWPPPPHKRTKVERADSYRTGSRHLQPEVRNKLAARKRSIDYSNELVNIDLTEEVQNLQATAKDLRPVNYKGGQANNDRLSAPQEPPNKILRIPNSQTEKMTSLGMGMGMVSRKKMEWL